MLRLETASEVIALKRYLDRRFPEIGKKRCTNHEFNSLVNDLDLENIMVEGKPELRYQPEGEPVSEAPISIELLRRIKYLADETYKTKIASGQKRSKLNMRDYSNYKTLSISEAIQAMALVGQNKEMTRDRNG